MIAVTASPQNPQWALFEFLSIVTLRFNFSTLVMGNARIPSQDNQVLLRFTTVSLGQSLLSISSPVGTAALSVLPGLPWLLLSLRLPGHRFLNHITETPGVGRFSQANKTTVWYIYIKTWKCVIFPSRVDAASGGESTSAHIYVSLRQEVRTGERGREYIKHACMVFLLFFCVRLYYR